MTNLMTPLMSPPVQALSDAHRALPRRRDALWFLVRACGLRVQRLWRDLVHPVRQWPQAHALLDAPVLAEVRTPLWTDGRSEEEFSLVAGKVHNLRLAVRAFDGVEVPAGEVLSFWRQLGRLSAARGYVWGREVREGCVIPTLGGGVCQLSNALATCAVRAGGVLVERHGHTHQIEASVLHPADKVDATVFWNYVDLRVQTQQPWRLEVELTRGELVMRVRGHRATSVCAPPSPAPTRVAIPLVQAPANRSLPPPVARGCLTCEETRCFRHQDHSALAQQVGRKAWLLDAWTPEFAHYLQGQSGERDVMVPRAARWGRWLVPGRMPWRIGAPYHVAWPVWARRAVSARWRRGGPGQRQARVLHGQGWLAAAYAKRLQPHHTELVIDQALLPWLWQSGVLGGRRFEVLMHSLPLAEVQRRLDAASALWPSDDTLRDFRAEAVLAQAEAQALRHAERLVTPHREVARVLRQSGLSTVHVVDWQLPDGPTLGALMAPIAETAAPCIVLGGSALGRKGMHELSQALQGQACELWVLGTPANDTQAWGDLTVRSAAYGGDWPRHASALVLPAHVEHAPRAALRAMAQGVPVIATPACGLEGLPGVINVPAGDVPALLAALAPWLNREGRTSRR